MTDDPYELLCESRPGSGGSPPAFERVWQRIEQTTTAEEQIPQDRSRTATPASRVRLRRARARAFVAVSVLVVLAVVGVALTTSHRNSDKTSTSPVSGAAPAYRKTAAEQLVFGQLAVLRRPQTGADQTAYQQLIAKHAAAIYGNAIPASARLIPLPDHGQLMIYLVTTLNAGNDHDPRTLPVLGLSERHGTSGEGSCCLTLREITQPTGLDSGNEFTTAPHPRPEMYFQIVPDGVAAVRLHFPPNPYDSSSTSVSTERRPLTVTLQVKDNVAAILLRPRGRPTTVTWLDSSGRNIKTYRTK